MTGIWWTSVSIEIFLCSLTATTAHLLMSLGQTLFHRYLGHRGIGGRFFENHLYIHHRHYSGNHVVSEHYLNKEANNTPFFLIPITLVISLGYLFLPLDLFVVQLTAMSISFYLHLYFDKHYHVAGSWLGRFAWFRRKQQLHFLHHRHADCNFAVVDNFWDRFLGTYRSVDADRELAHLNDLVLLLIIYHMRAATCWQPEAKGLSLMTNSIYNGWRVEDVWLDR